jgi:hypothetical protein
LAFAVFLAAFATLPARAEVFFVAFFAGAFLEARFTALFNALLANSVLLHCSAEVMGRAAACRDWRARDNALRQWIDSKTINTRGREIQSQRGVP